MKIKKLWGGRFEELPPKEIVDFLSGRDVREASPADERLMPYDLWGNRAHLLMLVRQGILSKQEGKKILKGLRELESLCRKGKFPLDPSKEDVHSNIESFLIDRLGIEYGGKIHTGRSRNDQVALDMRLYLRDQVLEYVEGLTGLIESILRQAEAHRSTIMPGYTHHQHAIPTTFGHLLLSFAEAFDRDIRRFIHWYDLFNENPLGAAAGYGTSFPLDRELTSKLLAFDGPTENVTDPITQRWEPESELAHAVAVMMNHLSTVAQNLILLSTSEFNMVRLHDRHCSGSSIMPQKRNPCTLEVMKAKTSFAHGMLLSLISVGKALFMGYNRDTQWTKYWIMDLVEETKPAVSVMAEVIRLLEVNRTQMAERTGRGFLGATSLMEWMAVIGRLPLRKAKMAVEKAVKYSEKEGAEEVTYASLRRAVKEIGIRLPLKERDVIEVQRPDKILSRNILIGGPSEKRFHENRLSLRERAKGSRDWLTLERREIEKAKKWIIRMEKKLAM